MIHSNQRVTKPDSVNVNEAVDIGCSQLKEFERTWPHGFHDPIKKIVVTMVTSKKHVKAGDTRVYDMDSGM